MPKHPRRAFSYVRFSTAIQAAGGSLQRQLKLSQAYCERKGLALDESLTLQDLGVSAFRGTNVREGALAGFREACRMGRVPRGSALIVESLDRLSRDQIRPALQLFMELQDHGITIVTLQPEREYSPESTDALALIEPLIVFARAHEESLMKSHRRKDGWRQIREKARAGGGPFMKTCPAWLEVTSAGFLVKEEAAATVRKIFQMAQDGLGLFRITAKLVADGVPTIAGKCWGTAYVYKILTGPAAMGTYQPTRQEGKKFVPDGEPIPAFYPVVVSEEEWQRTQGAVKGRGWARRAPGRSGKDEANLFTGLLRCAATGERMHLVHALGRKVEGERKRYVYLCSSRESGAPNRSRSIDYHSFEDALLSKLRELQVEDIIGGERQADEREAEVSRLKTRIRDIDGRLARVRERSRTAADFDTFLDLIQELQAERRQADDRLADLAKQEEARPADNLKETHSLIDVLASTPADKREELRRRLKARIRGLVSDMRVLIVPRGADRLAALQIRFASSNRCRDYFILHRSNKVTGSQWWARSLASVVQAGELDLRRPEDAELLEEALLAVDLSAEGTAA